MSVTADVRTDHLAIATRYAARPDDWPVAPRFNPARRWYHRLAEEDGFEVWVLTWLPGQGTDLHDHGGSAGAFVVCSGRLTEETLAPSARSCVGGTELAAHDLDAGSGHRFGPAYIHRISNRGTQPAVSVHVYGPALRTMTRYEWDAGRLGVVAVDRAGAQW